MWFVLFVMRFGRCVGFFALLFVLLVFLGSNFVSGVIWEPSVMGDCDSGGILTLWNEVFVEDNAGVVVFTELVVPEGDCGEYIAYKNNSDGEFWVLYGEFYDSSWGSSVDLYSSGKKIMDSVDLWVLYGNVSSSFLESFGGQSDVGVMKSLASGISDANVVDWSILSETEVKIKFNELYEFGDVGGVSFESGTSSFSFDESDEFDWNSFTVGLDVREDKALFSGEYLEENYDPSFFVEFGEDIGNFSFLKDSDWNLAFDYLDYFSVSSGVDVVFSYIGESNVNGAAINYSISGSDVSFMPAEGFTGWRDFRLAALSPAGDVVSNTFAVNISRYNEAPYLSEIIPNFNLAAGESDSVDLGAYFYDDDSLVFRAIGDNEVEVSFSGSVMTVGIDVNFSGYSRFRVYAFDGIATTYSDYIYVILEGYDSAELANELSGLNTSVVGVGNVSHGVGNASVGGGGASGDGVVDSEDKGWWFWVILGCVSFILAGGIMFAVYFFIIKKDYGGVSGGGSQDNVVSGGSSQAGEYVKKLGFGS